MKNKRSIIFLILISLLVGLIFSTSNILNSYSSRTNDEFNFLPIGEWDDLYYYSYARELLDGNLYSSDSQVKEYKQELTINTSYGISYFFTGISSWLTKDVVSGYYINRFIFPVINFILLFFLLAYLTKNFLYSIFCALLIIFFYDYFTLSFPYLNFHKIKSILYSNLTFDGFSYGFYRIPNIAFTNIISLLSMVSFYSFINNKKINSFLFICLILVVSAYTYLITFVICGCIFLIAFIYLLKQQLVRPIFIFISTVPIFIMISPIVYMFIDTVINVPPYYAQFNEMGIGYYGGGASLLYILCFYVTFNLMGIFILHLFDSSPYRKVNTLMFVSFILVLTICLLLFGPNNYERFIYRGILPIFLVIMFQIGYYILRSLLIDKKLIIRFYDSNRVNMSIDLTNTISRLKIFVQDRKTVIGITLVIMGIVLNEWVLAYLLSEDGIIDYNHKLKIWAFEIFCILFGITFIFYEKLYVFIKSMPYMFINIKFIKNIIVYFFIIFTLIIALVANIQTTKDTRYLWYNDRRDLTVFFEKLNKNTKTNDVVMTLDPEIQYRIPVYTHLNLYNPNVLITGFTGRKERVARLYDVMKFYKINARPFKYLLENRYESLYGYTKGVSHKTLESFPFQFWMSNYYWYPEIQEDIDAIVDVELDAYAKHDYDREKLINNIDYFVTSNFTSNIYRDFPITEKIDYSKFKILFNYKEFTVYKAQ